MESKTNYTLVGLMVLILSSSLIGMALWLSVGFGQKKYDNYAVYLREAVTGLNKEAAVKFNGVPVGFVSAIMLNEDDPQEVRLVLKIEQGTPITISTTATLISQGITGTSYLGLSASSPSLTLLKKSENDPYPIIPSKPSLFNQLDTVFKGVAENVKNLSENVRRIFDKENAKSLKTTLSNLEQITSILAKNSQHINASLKHADTSLSNFAKASQDFPSIVNDLKQGISRFNAMTLSMSSTSLEVTQTMASGKNAINKFSQQTLPSTTILMKRLDSIAANLEKVSAQMRQNPAVIIRGTAAPTLGPGESH